MISSFDEDAPHTSAAERKRRAEREIRRITTENPHFMPLRIIYKRNLTQSFWGRAWNRNLASLNFPLYRYWRFAVSRRAACSK